MSLTLIGVFDRPDDAQQAAERLRSAGIDDASIRIEAGSTEVVVDRRPERRRFFAELFGLGDDDIDAAHYDEALQRGCSALTVAAADEARVHEITGILEDCGAIDVEQRIEQWRGGGGEAAPGAAPGAARPRVRVHRRAASAAADDEDLRDA